MPEVQLCTHCKKPVDKSKENFVVVAKEVDRSPEVVAHMECEQNRPKYRPMGLPPGGSWMSR